jgi:hypothetical protein
MIHYLHASSFPNGNFAVLNASTPAILTADNRLSDPSIGSLPLLEKNSSTQADADLPIDADLSAIKRDKDCCNVMLLVDLAKPVGLVGFCIFIKAFTDDSIAIAENMDSIAEFIVFQPASRRLLRDFFQ